MTKSEKLKYRQDILGSDYECCDLEFPNDYDGKVIATLVRKKSSQTTQKAVLYVHGFIDYFFQTEMADQFNKHGYDFYALDLRKYGRSHLAHQAFFNVHDLREYDAEISKALEVIGNENHSSVLLAGHSTGGLITTLFCAHYPNHPLIKGLWVNSPFYGFNKSEFEKKLGIPSISKLAKYLPDIQVPSGLNKWYVASLHISLQGEWNFNLEWKPEQYPFLKISFVRAIFESHRELHQGIYLSVPTLVMHSDRTTNPKNWGVDAQSSDVILDVEDIKKYGQKISGHVTLCEIKNGLHDLVLSAPDVREQVYKNLFNWLQIKFSS